MSLHINGESAGKYLLSIATLAHHLYNWMDGSSSSQCTGDRCEKENEGERVGKSDLFIKPTDERRNHASKDDEIAK